MVQKLSGNHDKNDRYDALVLTAMLALNVSADILNGFIMVNKLLGNIETGHRQKTALYDEMQFMTKIRIKWANGCKKSKLVQQKRDSLLDLYIRSKLI